VRSVNIDCRRNKLAANTFNEPELQCLCNVFHQYDKSVTVYTNVSAIFEVFKVSVKPEKESNAIQVSFYFECISNLIIYY
jgi:hypothetical protein